MNGPETRSSLILSIRDPQRHEAWEEFVAIYWPVVHRLAIKKGFQDADANDLCQEVLTSVGKAVHRFDPDSNKGSFRGWLFRIARNLMLNVLTRNKETPGSGDTAIQDLLEQQVETESEEATQFDLEYEREVFHWVANRVREQSSTDAWQSFWRTAIEGQPAPKVALELGKSTGAVRVARCRILSRIKRQLDRLDYKQLDETKQKPLHEK